MINLAIGLYNFVNRRYLLAGIVHCGSIVIGTSGQRYPFCCIRLSLPHW